MHQPTFALALAAIVLVLAGGGAQACDGEKVLFNDDFSFADASWGDQNNNFSIRERAAVIKPESGRGYKALDNAFLFEDADICVTVTAVEIGKPEESAGGLAFWAQNYKNAYFLLLASNGYFKIGRMVDGNWVNSPLDWAPSDAIVQGINQSNTLHLTIKGQELRVEINGKPAAKLLAQAPAAPSLIGLYAESGEVADTWKFTTLKVTDVKKAEKSP